MISVQLSNELYNYMSHNCEVLYPTEVLDWCYEHKIKFITNPDCVTQIQFKNGTDAMAFKLRWL